MFLPYFDYGDDDAFTLWESLSRSDILMAVLCVASIAVAVVSLAQARARVAHALTIAAGGVLFGIFGFYLIEYSPDRGYAAGALIGGIAALLGLVGAVLLSAGVGKLGAAAAQRPQQAVAVAPATTPRGLVPRPLRCRRPTLLGRQRLDRPRLRPGLDVVEEAKLKPPTRGSSPTAPGGS